MTYQITYETKEELLQHVMEEVREEYLDFVHEKAAGRKKEQGIDFHESDFVAGASLFFFLLNANNGKFPAAWALNMFRGESAMFWTEDEDGKKQFEPFRPTLEAYLTPLTEQRPSFTQECLFCSSEGGPVQWGRYMRFDPDSGIGLWQTENDDDWQEGTHWVKGFTNPWGNW